MKLWAMVFTFLGLIGLGLSFYHAGLWSLFGLAGLAALLVSGHLHARVREDALDHALEGVGKRIETLEVYSRMLANQTKTADNTAASPVTTTDRRRAH